MKSFYHSSALLVWKQNKNIISERWQKLKIEKRVITYYNVNFFQMCHMYDRICFRWPCEIPAMPSYLPYQMHRRLVNAELYLSILHGASGRGTFDYVRKPILNKEWVAIVRAHMCDVWSHVCVLKKVYPVRYVCHVEQLYRTTMLKTICE